MKIYVQTKTAAIREGRKAARSRGLPVYVNYHHGKGYQVSIDRSLQASHYEVDPDGHVQILAHT